MTTCTGEDPYINGQSVVQALADLRDCAIAVDAAYYIQLQLDAEPREPLLPALGGLTGIKSRLEADLDAWKANGVIPFFIFDGQPITGQDETTLVKSRRANHNTDLAWDLYFGTRALEAVQTFGTNNGAFNTRCLFPLLQEMLRQRELHFLVAPYNAAAQMAYFDMIDSDQCAGVMGSLELMLYPINDCIIRSIDWENQTVTAVSKKHILKSLNITDEALLVDAILMTGTSFLPPFPPLVDAALTKNQPHSVTDALNVLRAATKSVTLACNTFQDVLDSKDQAWLDKYRKARMAVSHFIYIAESGEVQVHDSEGLTADAHEYLGVQLPSELYHYVNTGIISPRLLSWITHGRMEVLSTIDGFVSDEYKNLVEKGSVRIKEIALSLVEPRLNRGISHKPITMRVWYDRDFKYTMTFESEGKGGAISRQVASWNVGVSSIKAHFPQFQHGSILSEVTALANPEFSALTLAGEGARMKGTKSAGLIQSICLWRFLHLRGYVDDKHALTNRGKALAETLIALQPKVGEHPEANLYEQALVAHELIHLDLLNAGNRHEELRGYPMNGSEDDKASLLLISRCATLLKMRHKSNGYTGPLSKSLLCFRSLASEVRSADRDLIEALVASMFLYAQADRKRDDGWELSHQLPFLNDPDVALGIAVKTYFDEVVVDSSPEERMANKAAFTTSFMPHTVDFESDLEMACNFFDAIYAGVKLLDTSSIGPAKRRVWDTAAVYLSLRR